MLIDRQGQCFAKVGSLSDDSKDKSMAGNNIIGGTLSSIAMNTEQLASLIGVTGGGAAPLIHVRFDRGEALTIKGQPGVSHSKKEN